jgi:hypothetical protein
VQGVESGTMVAKRLALLAGGNRRNAVGSGAYGA